MMASSAGPLSHALMVAGQEPSQDVHLVYGEPGGSGRAFMVFSRGAPTLRKGEAICFGGLVIKAPFGPRFCLEAHCYARLSSPEPGQLSLSAPSEEEGGLSIAHESGGLSEVDS